MMYVHTWIVGVLTNETKWIFNGACLRVYGYVCSTLFCKSVLPYKAKHLFVLHNPEHCIYYFSGFIDNYCFSTLIF